MKHKIELEPPQFCSSGASLMHKVQGDKIVEATTGKEVMWRGAGCSYLMHSTGDPLLGWQRYLPEIKAMGINTMRLAFQFSWDQLTGATADVLDYAKMDAVISFLAQNNIRSILDYHGSSAQMFGSNGISSDQVNPQLIRSWIDLATHCKNSASVVAYEIYNEPSITWGTSYNVTPRKNAEGYNLVSRAIRQVDSEHILIWESPTHYIPPFDQIQDLLLPNVVYTAHRWWTNNEQQIKLYGAEELSRIIVDAFVGWRSKYNIPIWLGEFGGPGGGSSPIPYTPADSFWQICEQLLYRCEEQVIPWNLWLGKTAVDVDRFAVYMPLFPLKIFNPNLIRQPWILPHVPPLSRFIIASNGVDILGDYEVQMWHNKDFVTLSSGIVVKIVTSHLKADSTWEYFEEVKSIREITTIQNEEGTTAHPDDWNIKIYSLAYVPTIPQSILVLALCVSLPILGYFALG